MTFWGLYSVFLPQMRYRLPLDFMLILIAAGGLSHILQHGSGRARPVGSGAVSR